MFVRCYIFFMNKYILVWPILVQCSISITVSFWRFQETVKWNIGLKWVKLNSRDTGEMFIDVALVFWFIADFKQMFVHRAAVSQVIYCNSSCQLLSHFRSSHRRCFEKKVFLKVFLNFTGKHLCWSLLLITLQAFRPLLKRLY